MKKAAMISGLLAALVLAAPLAAVADDDDRRKFEGEDRWEDHGHGQRRYDVRHVRHGDARVRHGQRYRRGHGGRRDWYGSWWRYPRLHGWRRGWPQRWHPRRGYGPRWEHWNNGSFITGALIGSTLTRSALHERGDHRYCDHDRRRGDFARCYRVERLPGGRERRVPLPDRACF